MIPSLVETTRATVLPHLSSLHVGTLEPLTIGHTWNPIGTGFTVGLVGFDERSIELTNLLFWNVSQAVNGGQCNAFVIYEQAPLTAALFAKDEANRRVLIRGPFLTVSQLKIAFRYTLAILAVDDSDRLVPLHSSVVASNGFCLAILGPSGAGKSWVSRHLVEVMGCEIRVRDWCVVDSKRGVILGDDERCRVIRGPEANSFRARGERVFPLEIFEENELSSQSRFVATPVPVSRVEAPSVLSHVLLLSDPARGPLRAAYGAGPIARSLSEVQPRLTDEAIDELPERAGDSAVRRTVRLLDDLRGLLLVGHRAPGVKLSEWSDLVTEWLRGNPPRTGG